MVFPQNLVIAFSPQNLVMVFPGESLQNLFMLFPLRSAAAREAHYLREWYTGVPRP